MLREREEVVPRPVSRIHILIHPGFATDPDVMEEIEPQYETLLEKYIEESRGMNQDEVMVTFTHTTAKQLREDLQTGKSYTTALRGLRKVLKDRLIVIADDGGFVSSYNLGNQALAVMQSRGFTFNREEVETIAYGEADGACVIDGAIMFNVSAHVRRPTIIRRKLTDAIFQSEEENRQSLEDISSRFAPISIEDL